MPANDKQVGGNHYRTEIQHWDWASANELDYFQGCITKYVARHKKKNGLEDLLKAQHFLFKYIEQEYGVEESEAVKIPSSTPVPGSVTFTPNSELNGGTTAVKIEDGEEATSAYVNQD